VLAIASDGSAIGRGGISGYGIRGGIKGSDRFGLFHTGRGDVIIGIAFGSVIPSGVIGAGGINSSPPNILFGIGRLGARGGAREGGGSCAVLGSVIPNGVIAGDIVAVSIWSLPNKGGLKGSLIFAAVGTLEDTGGIGLLFLVTTAACSIPLVSFASTAHGPPTLVASHDRSPSCSA